MAAAGAVPGSTQGRPGSGRRDARAASAVLRGTCPLPLPPLRQPGAPTCHPQAHRRIMVANHPDAGGSSFIAAKVGVRSVGWEGTMERTEGCCGSKGAGGRQWRRWSSSKGGSRMSAPGS